MEDLSLYSEIGTLVKIGHVICIIYIYHRNQRRYLMIVSRYLKLNSTINMYRVPIIVTKYDDKYFS